MASVLKHAVVSVFDRSGLRLPATSGRQLIIHSNRGTQRNCSASLSQLAKPIDITEMAADRRLSTNGLKSFNGYGTKTPFLIGVAGGTASGKVRFLEAFSFFFL